MCHLLTRYQSTIFPNHKSCVRKKGVPSRRAPFFRLRDVSVVERDDVHRVGFAVTRAVGERVSDFVAVPYDGGPRRAENRSGGEYVVVADGDRIGHRAAARAVGEVEQLLSLLPDDALLLEAVGVVTRRVERVSEPADGGGFGIGTAIGQGVEQLPVFPDRCDGLRCGRGVTCRVDVVAGGFRRFGGVVVRTARREAGECGEKRR